LGVWKYIYLRRPKGSVPHLPVGLMELWFTAVGWIVWGFRSCCLGSEPFFVLTSMGRQLRSTKFYISKEKKREISKGRGKKKYKIIIILDF
jgi:hypothetical protein